VSLKDVTQSADLLGAVARLPRNFLPGRLTQDTIKLEPKRPDVPLEYLYWLLRTPEYRSYCRAHATGTTNLGLARDDFLAFPAPEPTPIQWRIVDTLGTLDEKIELNRRMSETLEAMARALFKSWFVDFDPVRAKAEGRDCGLPKAVADLFPDRLVDFELGEIPQGWAAKPLGQWVDALSGGTPSKTDAEFWGGDVPWVSPKVMTSIHADEADAYVTRSAIGNGTRVAPSGSTLVMVRGMGLHEGVRVSFARRDVTFNQDVKALVPSSIDPDLLLFALLDSQGSLLDRVESSGHGTGKLPTEILLSLRIVMPPAPIQSRLAEPIRKLNRRIGAARDQSRTLAALRDALLPKLISGELRVKDAERFLERATEVERGGA
jgi:type I restriction enzyme S subunit